MLQRFGVASSRIWLQPGNLRNKDGKKTVAMSFAVRTKSLPAFKREIGFDSNTEKNKLLGRAAKRAGRNCDCYNGALWFSGSREAETPPEHWRIKSPKKPNANLARFVAYLMRYGNIIGNLKQFYVVSPSENVITDFARVIKDEFGLAVPYARKISGKSYKCLVCSVEIVRWLQAQGLPCGRSALRSCGAPEWIKNNEEYYNTFSQVFDA